MAYMVAGDKFYTNLQKVLLEEKIVSPADLHEARREHEETRDSLLDVLIRQGRCHEKKLVQVLSRETGCTAVNPAVFLADKNILKRIPQRLAEKHLALPISLFENTLTVAFANPLNLKAIDELHAVTGLRIKPAIAQASLIKRCIETYYKRGMEMESAEAGEGKDYHAELGDVLKAIEVEQAEAGRENSRELMREAFETPVIKLVNRLLLDGIRRRASDIFIEPWENHVRVRARVDGLLEEVVRPPKSLASAIVSRIKVMSELDIAEHRIPQDGRFKIKTEKKEVDMRVSVLPTSFGEKVCLRILDTTAQSHDIGKLGFSGREQQIIKDSARKPHGMILVTGPTGSGKTTTLYSVLKYLDAPEVNITTVEDPVEYQLPGINQVNVREPIGLTFPAALRSILRQDPDIILIGEIRDNETLDIAVKAALTGHLVLSTLHTNDASSSITRMMNMGLEPFLISSTIVMISAQRLLRKICPKCRASYKPGQSLLKELCLDAGKEYLFYRPKGCAHCRNSGYAGRTVITELLEMSPVIRSLVMEGASSARIKERAREEGMTTLRECAIRKVVEGETSVEEVYRVTTADALPGKKEAA